MNKLSKQTLVVLGTLLSLASWAPAEEWNFSDLGSRVTRQEQEASTEGLQQWRASATSALSQNRSGENELPATEGDPFNGESNGENHEGAYGYCSDGSCNCNESGQCCEGGSCPCDCCESGEYVDCGAPACGNAVGCGSACGCGCACGDPGCCGTCCEKDLGTCYFEVQVMALRPHVNEEVAGKLREKYEFSPRFIWGYESPLGVGGRARYWTYGRTTQTLDGDPLRFEFEVLDVEATSHFRSDRTELTLAGGVRWADIVLAEDDDAAGTTMPGITAAADIRTAICRGCNWHWAGVGGVRWSMLGGDWEGDDDGLVEPVRDDNLVVHEIYGGVEYLRSFRSCDIYTRLVFEVQNWHSDALDIGSDTDSISFVGPGIHSGVNF